MSVGFVGISDGWTELEREKTLKSCFERAEGGNVCPDGGTRSGKRRRPVRAGASAWAGTRRSRPAPRGISLIENTESLRAEYVGQWLDWQGTLTNLPMPEEGGRDLYRLSAAVIHAHESKNFREESSPVCRFLGVSMGRRRHRRLPLDLAARPRGSRGGLSPPGKDLSWCAACSTTCNRRKRPTDVGRKICGVDGDLYWQGIRWMKSPCPSCWRA